MGNNDHQEWLNSLKIGDEVAVNYTRLSTVNYEIRKIIRITPTRRFSVEGRSTEYDSFGRERGKRDAWSSAENLEPVTQKIKDHIRKNYVMARIESVKWKTIGLDKLERILQVLDSDDNGPEATVSTEYAKAVKGLKGNHQ